MAETARARVDQDRDLAFGEPVCRRSLLVEDSIDPLQFDEVVAGSERPELAGAPGQRALGHGRRVGTGDAAARLGQLEVLLGADAEGFEQCPWTFPQHFLQAQALDAERPFPAGAGRNAARDLLNQGGLL
jgi:hypothetical protein